MSILVDRTKHLVAESRSQIGFDTEGGGYWPVWDHYLTVHGKRAYHLGNICGTCRFLFERMEGAAGTVDVGALAGRLAMGVGHIEDGIVDALGLLMPAASYEVLLLRTVPAAVTPGSATDYFAVEQIDNEGIEPFWGLPHHPRVPYYRTGDRSMDVNPPQHRVLGGRIFEFIVPMFPQTLLDEGRVRHYEAVLSDGVLPTAVALSVLDAKTPATRGDPHWGLAHYLLDGHHKVAAAARLRCPVSLVSFLATDRSVARQEDIDTVLSSLDWSGAATTTDLA